MRRTVALALTLLSATACSRAAGPESTAPAPAAAPGQQAPAAAPQAAPAEQTTVRYAPVTARYRVETQQHTEQDMMGNVQAFDATTNQLLTVSLAPRGDSLGMTVVIDSISLTTDAPGGAEAAASVQREVQGKRFTGTMTTSGTVVSLTADSVTDAATRMVSSIRSFLPVLPAGPLTAGREWVDTVSTTNAMGPMSMTTRNVRTHRIVGWEPRDGARALRLTTRSAYTMSGSGETQGQALELAGQGRGVHERFMSATGVFLGGTTADTTEINVNVVSAGMTIPIRQTERATVTKLP